MSMTEQRVRDLVAAYNRCLEKQIVDQGSSLPCRDEKLCNEVEKLLKSEDGRDTHCLGLDTFKIMEESLKSAVANESKQAAKVRTGLKGLAKAFEVLEQAALNLYLGPWREEYKVVKMYSGLFTHFIKPVFSMQQIEQLFGLLGYNPCSTHREQLSLQPQKVSAASVDDMLCLSCAFFVARCECRLLLAALGKQSGQLQQELSVVRERQRGHSLQVALDSTMRMVDVKQPIKELPEEGDIDLYTDEHESEGLKEMPGDEPPCSLPWMAEKSANGVSREQIYTSTHYSQLKKPSADLTVNGFSSMSRYDHFYDDAGDKVEAQPVSLFEEKTEHEVQSLQPCTCLEVKNLCLYKCIECQTYHHVTCPRLNLCVENHQSQTQYVNDIPEQFIPLRAAASHRRGSISPTLTSNTAAFSSLVLHDDQKSTSPVLSPMAYHYCCNLSLPDPQILCFTCKQFHSKNCERTNLCLSCHHTRKMGLCSEGVCTERRIAILCRYCGNEFCKTCWFKNPMKCSCGQTFDQSSSV